MSGCASQGFDTITPSVWTCIVQKVATYGININSNSGEATQNGFTVRWDYDPNAQTLQIQCTDGPWWAPCSTINGKIHELVDGCR